MFVKRNFGIIKMHGTTIKTHLYIIKSLFTSLHFMLKKREHYHVTLI